MKTDPFPTIDRILWIIGGAAIGALIKWGHEFTSWLMGVG